MKPLGMYIGIIHAGTLVYDVTAGKYLTIKQKIRVNLIVRRDNTYSFVYNNKEYIVHADNVTLE